MRCRRHSFSDAHESDGVHHSALSVAITEPSNPRAIAVCADDAVVTLTGDVLASDVSGVLRGAAGVRGVNFVQNNMTVHQSADGIPALQGSSRRPDQWTTWLREGWSPSAMLLAGTATAAAAIVTAVAVRRAA